MKIHRPASDLRGPENSWIARFASSWSRFWFEPRSAFGLHAVRVLTGLLLLAWLLPLAGHHQALFGLGHGWFDIEAYNETAAPQFQFDRGPLGWSVLYLAGANAGMLNFFYWATIGIFVLFTLGIATRITSVLTWVMAVSYLTNATNYEADFLLVILAFYLMIAYVLHGQWSRNLTPIQRILGTSDAAIWNMARSNTSEESPRSYAATLVLRLLQVHMAIIIVTSALHKLQFGYWWSGVAYWFPLHSPFATTAESLRNSATVSSTYLFFLSLVQYLVLAWQIAFPAFAWRKSFRWLLIGGSALGWLGTMIVLQQPLFGPFFFIGTLAFLTPGEWQWVESKLNQLGSVFAGWSKSQEKPAKVQVRT